MQDEVKTEASGKFKMVISAIGKFIKDLWMKIFLPALKDVISVSVNRTTQHILYKTPIDQERPNNGSRPSDQGTPWNPSPRPVQNRQDIWIDTQPNRFGVNQLCSNTRRGLEDVLSKMQARINESAGGRVVSVGEMYTYGGCMAGSQDYNDGWHNLSGFCIRFDTTINGYTLCVTEPIRL